MPGADANRGGPDRAGAAGSAQDTSRSTVPSPIAAAVPGTRFTDVRWVPTTGSTNADLLAVARDGGSEGVVLVADHQRAGRGRRARSWQAPAGSSLLCSVLLRPPAPVASLVGMAMGVAAVETVINLGVVDARLKWPNDVIVVGRDGGHDSDAAVLDRKLGGILAEADWPPGSGMSDGWRQPWAGQRVAVVVGLGLNVQWPLPGSPEFPDELAGMAVALNHLVDRVIDRDEILGALLRRLDHWYDRLVTDGARPLFDVWRDHAATIGRRVRVDLGTEDVVGIAVDVTAEGHLVVIDETDGRRRVLAVGDVVHVRPP